MTQPHVKIGIDVGGTFTHAVAVDAGSAQLLGATAVPTTHTAEEGVARGVVLSMRALLANHSIQPDQILLIAHSTTQATNALLEGDVAPVGIIGMGKGIEGWRARSQTNVRGIELAPGKMLKTAHRFLDVSGTLERDAVRRAWAELRAEGAAVCVASEAFGVDDDRNERAVVEILSSDGVLATSAASLSRLYGLRMRTRTAVINASMMVLMLETAAMTERAVRESGIRAPLMVMRSDGGIMDIEQMRRRPILTMLSGPAAGVAAALISANISDGVFVEVGGTSTDISLIRNGRPSIRSAEVGGHRLHVRTLDVRTVGLGGGSMVRMNGAHVVDVGPRSAHIAGLRYPSFARPEELQGLRADQASPRKGDPADYVVLGREEAEFALTTTDAANLLGEVRGYGAGRTDAIELLRTVLARTFSHDPGELARTILRRASVRPAEAIGRLVRDYEVLLSDLTLVGGGGGARPIIPWIAERLGMEWKIAEHAEIISALGVALGMIQDTVERSLISPTEADLLALRHEAAESVIRMGAEPSTVEVRVEVDARRKTARATAQGSPEFSSEGRRAAASDDERAAAAARSLGAPAAEVRAVARTGFLAVYEHRRVHRRWGVFARQEHRHVRVLDAEGVVRLRLLDPVVHCDRLGALPEALGRLIDEQTAYGDAGAVIPGVFVLVSARLIDLSALVRREQVTSLLRAETVAIPQNEQAVALLVAKR